MSLDMPAAASPATAPPADGSLLDSVAAIFCRVLEAAEVPADGNFFLLGGDSLIATRVLSAVARAHAVELSFEEFVADPTPAGVADRVAAAGLTGVQGAAR
ncbi:phosphopantetheine-binding protein [Kitasatospora sp. NPDC049285]|uniref:phosphopantetheine-binding protein n=1 Tax=Kitasatospora sp. NPDC049285 TaxID=3157096 RepID=UPI003412D75E